MLYKEHFFRSTFFLSNDTGILTHWQSCLYILVIFSSARRSVRHQLLRNLHIHDSSTSYEFTMFIFVTESLSRLYTETPFILAFQREESLHPACKDRNASFTSEEQNNINIIVCRMVCQALTLLLDNIYIRFGTNLFRQIVGIPLETDYAALVSGLISFCYERDF